MDLDAGLVQRDYLGQPSDVAYDNRRSRRHCLQSYDPERLIDAGEDCNVCYLEETVAHFVRHSPWEKYTILNSKIARFCTKASKAGLSLSGTSSGVTNGMRGMWSPVLPCN